MFYNGLLELYSFGKRWFKRFEDLFENCGLYVENYGKGNFFVGYFRKRIWKRKLLSIDIWYCIMLILNFDFEVMEIVKYKIKWIKIKMKKWFRGNDK